MSGKKDNKTIKARLFAIACVVMGAIASFAFVFNAYFDLVFEYRRSMIGCLILAAVYSLLGIALMIICLRSKERLLVQVVSVIVSVLLVPSTVLVSLAMCSITFRPVVCDNCKDFSNWEEGFFEEGEIPSDAGDYVCLSDKDGHVKAVSFILDGEKRERYENEVYEYAPNGFEYGLPVAEYSETYGFDLENKYGSLIGEDNVNDYVVLEVTLGNEWHRECFVNRNTGRYIVFVTHLVC